MSRNDQFFRWKWWELSWFHQEMGHSALTLESRKKAAELCWEQAGSWPEAMKLGLKELDVFIHHIFFLQDTLCHLGALLLLKPKDQPRSVAKISSCCDVATYEIPWEMLHKKSADWNPYMIGTWKPQFFLKWSNCEKNPCVTQMFYRKTGMKNLHHINSHPTPHLRQSLQWWGWSKSRN